MTYDPGLAERVAGALAGLPRAAGVRQRGVFSGRGFLIGRTTFVIIWGDGLIVKLLPPHYPAALAEPGVTPFAPGGDRRMSTWVVVAAERLDDDPDLLFWLERGLAGIGR